MSVVNRTGERIYVPFRTNRYFTVFDKWYFSTREGYIGGPYADRDRAQDGLRRFLKVVEMLPFLGEQEQLADYTY